MKNLLISLTGHTCSGKNYLLEQLITKNGFSRVITSTTRPKRDGEVEGVDYYFITPREHQDNNLGGGYVEFIIIGDYFYGVTRTEFETKLSKTETPAIIILTPEGIDQFRNLTDNIKVQFLNFFVDTPERVRFERLAKRTIDDMRDGDKVDVLVGLIQQCKHMSTAERYWNEIYLDMIPVDGTDLDWALEVINFHVKRMLREHVQPQGTVL